MKEIQETIDRTSDEVTDKIDWTKKRKKKYPVLAAYQNEVDVEVYADELRKQLDHLQKQYGYDDLNAFLVLKDILAAVWKERKGL